MGSLAVFVEFHRQMERYVPANIYVYAGVIEDHRKIISRFKKKMFVEMLCENGWQI